jgi:hypothetical protein
MNQVVEDPRVSCPIVCGKYRAATGFFYSDGEFTYLVTARHNVLPTFGEKLRTGELDDTAQSREYLPKIDVYLRVKRDFIVWSLDIRESNSVVEVPEIDVIMIPFAGDPEGYGYQIWNKEDVSSVQYPPGKRDVIGYNSTSFPDADCSYDVTTLDSEIDQPVIHSVEDLNLYIERPRHFGTLTAGIDPTFAGDHDELKGLSGAPVLGQGLLGVYSRGGKTELNMLNQSGGDTSSLVYYTQADVLPWMIDNAVVE